MKRNDVSRRANSPFQLRLAQSGHCTFTNLPTRGLRLCLQAKNIQEGLDQSHGTRSVVLGRERAGPSLLAKYHIIFPDVRLYSGVLTKVERDGAG